MKTKLPILACLFALPLSAQEPGRPRVIPPGNQPRPHVPMNDEARGLTENIAIQLDGVANIGGHFEKIEISVAGTGPKFTSEHLLAEKGTVLRCDYVVMPEDSGYRIAYSIGFRIKEPMQNGTFQYYDLSVNGTALCVPGKAVQILDNGGNPLLLSVSKMENQGPAEGGGKNE